MRREREGGFTLAEVLVSVAMLGITFSVIVGGLGTAIITSNVDRQQATAQNLLRTLAEDIKAEDYVECEDGPSYGASFLPPSGFGHTVDIEYWIEATNTFQSTCGLNDDGLQRISLGMASVDDAVLETLVMFKRKP